ncbi:hypothetical protein BJ912DRAFT_922341 [Pholiota molesta]|nr:hypothetical protein BJ912DRAFT_922341 [Pholiota molesta]
MPRDRYIHIQYIFTLRKKITYEASGCFCEIRVQLPEDYLGAGSTWWHLPVCRPTSQNCVVRLGCGRRTLAKLTFQAQVTKQLIWGQNQKCITHQSLKVQSRSRERSSSLHKDSFPTQTSRPSATSSASDLLVRPFQVALRDANISTWNNQFDPAKYAVMITSLGCECDEGWSYFATWRLSTRGQVTISVTCRIHFASRAPPLEEFGDHFARSTLHTHNARSDGECKTHSSSLRRTGQDFLSRVMRPQVLSPQERIRELHQSSDGPSAPEKAILTRHHGTWLAPVPLWAWSDTVQSLFSSPFNAAFNESVSLLGIPTRLRRERICLLIFTFLCSALPADFGKGSNNQPLYTYLRGGIISAMLSPMPHIRNTSKARD